MMVTYRHLPAQHAVALRTAPTAAAGSASWLIRETLGAEALRKYRSSERAFPLRHGDTYYSVSRTRGLTTLAVATTPIGVDVECRLARDITADIAWALSPDELLELAISKGCRLTEIWTAKEASGKALGVGLGETPNRILTLPVPGKPGYRVAEVPKPRHAPTRLLTYGWWSNNHHISLAWTPPTRGASQNVVEAPR